MTDLHNSYSSVRSDLSILIICISRKYIIKGNRKECGNCSYKSLINPLCKLMLLESADTQEKLLLTTYFFLMNSLVILLRWTQKNYRAKQLKTSRIFNTVGS